MPILGGSGPQMYVDKIYPETPSPNKLIVPAKCRWISSGTAESRSQIKSAEDMFIVTNRTQLETTHFLTPIIYTYDREGIVIKDMLEPRMSHFPYILSSIGGEEVRKEGAIIGVVYINKNPVDVIPSTKNAQTITVHLKDLRSTILVEIKKLTVKISNVTAFITKNWNLGISTDSELIETILEKARWKIKLDLQNKPLSEILENADKIRELVFSTIQEVSKEYHLHVVDTMIDIKIPTSTKEYYYWHVLRGIPEETIYAINLLKELKETTPELLPVVGPLMVVSVLDQRDDIRKITEAVLDRILRNILLVNNPIIGEEDLIEKGG